LLFRAPEQKASRAARLIALESGGRARAVGEEGDLNGEIVTRPHARRRERERAAGAPADALFRG